MVNTLMLLCYKTTPDYQLRQGNAVACCSKRWAVMFGVQFKHCCCSFNSESVILYLYIHTNLFPIPAACSSKKMICESGMAMQHSCGRKNSIDYQSFITNVTYNWCGLFVCSVLSYMIFKVPPYQPMCAQQRNSNIQLSLIQWQKNIWHYDSDLFNQLTLLIFPK